MKGITITEHGVSMMALAALVALLAPLSAAAQSNVAVITTGAGPFVPGAGFNITHNVINGGPDPATGVLLTSEWLDAEPIITGFAWEGDWLFADDLLASRVGTIAAEGTEAITVYYELPSDAHLRGDSPSTSLGLLVNIEADNDPVPQNLNLYALEMSPTADLVVDAVALDAEAAPGGSALIEISILNNGPSDVKSPSINVTGVGVAAASGDAGSLYIPAGDSRKVTFRVDVDEAAVVGAVLTAQVSVDLPAGYTETGDGDETDSVDITVVDNLPPADLGVVVSVDSPVVAGGATTTVTMTVTNNGPAPAEGVSVHDIFFYPWTITGANAPGYAINGGFSAMRLQPMPAGATDTITFFLGASASAEIADVNNYAFVAADNPDPNTANNVSMDVYSVTRAVDLLVDMVPISTSVAPGGWALVEVTLYNNGPSDLEGQTGSINIMGGVSIGGISGDAGAIYIPAGESRSFLFGLQILDSAAVGSTIELTASMGLPEGYTEVGDGNEEDTATITVSDPLPDADVQVVDVRLVGGGPIVPGNTYTFEIDAVNNGPADALGAVLTTLFWDVPYIPNTYSSWPEGWNLGGSGGTWTRTAPWPSGVQQTFAINVIVPADAHYVAAMPIDVFRAFIAAANPDTNTENNGFRLQFQSQAQATLSIQKTLLNDNVAPGGTAFYQIAVTNQGPSDIQGIAVTDTPGANLDASTLVLGPDAANLYIPAGQTRTVMATVKVAESAVPGQQFVNTAAVDVSAVVAGDGSVLPPVVNAPSTGDVVGTVANYMPPADLSVNLTMGPGNATAGGTPIPVTITVTNNGPAPAEGVSVHDLFFFPWLVDNIDCQGYALNGAFAAVRLQPMPAGATDTITFNLFVPADVAPTSYANFAFVAADNPDPDTENNVSLAFYTIVGEASLDVEKTSLINPVGQGQMLLYEITVRNNGPSALPPGAVVLTDTLFPLVQFAGASPGCVFDGPAYPGTGGVVTCTVNDILNVNETADFLIQVKVPYDVPIGTIIANSVVAETPSLNTEEWTVTGDSDFVETEVVAGPFADLRVTKMVKPDGQVDAGETFTYWIYVDNLGPAQAVDVTLLDEMISDGEFSVLSVESNRGGTTTLESLPAVSVNNELSFEYTIDTLDAYDRWTVKVTAMANETIDVNNTVRVFPGNPTDPDLTNNYAQQSINIDDVADLGLSKSAIGDSAAGMPLTYVIEVWNDGPSTAENVVVTDLLPIDVCVTGVLPSRGSCQLGIPGNPAAPLMWAVGTLAPGESASLTIDVLVAADVEEGTRLANSAAVVSDTFDADISDNVAWNVVWVRAEADLSISAEAVPDPVTAGQLLTYTVRFTNNGLAAAHDVYIVDVFPPEVEIVSVNLFDAVIKDAVEPGRFVQLADKLICEVGDLAPEDGGTLVIEAIVPANTPDMTLVNTATISSSADDTDTSNNTAVTNTVVVGCAVPAAPDLVIATSGTSNSVVMLGWAAVTGATQYKVYRSDTEDFATAELIGSTVETEYMDFAPLAPHVAEAPPGCHYFDHTHAYYWVVAANDCGDGEPSDPEEGHTRIVKSASASSPAGSLVVMTLLVLGLCCFKRTAGQRS